MESFLASCVQRCLQRCPSSTQPGESLARSKKLAKKQKKSVPGESHDVDPSKFLTSVPTPFLDETDQRESPQGTPCDGPSHPDAVVCPWCRHKFVNSANEQASLHKNTELVCPQRGAQLSADIGTSTAESSGEVAEGMRGWQRLR